MAIGTQKYAEPSHSHRARVQDRPLMLRRNDLLELGRLHATNSLGRLLQVFARASISDAVLAYQSTDHSSLLESRTIRAVC